MWGILNSVVQIIFLEQPLCGKNCLKQEIQERNCPVLSQEVTVGGDDKTLNKYLNKLLTNYNYRKCFIGDQQPFW